MGKARRRAKEQGWKRRRERRSKSRSRERSTKRRYARQLRARRRAHERRKKYRMALRRARIANARRRERRWKKNKKEKSYKLWRRARARARRAKERARKYLRSKKRALERRSKYWNERRKKKRIRHERKVKAIRRWKLIRRRAAERRAGERRLKKMSKEKAAKVIKKLRERRGKWRRRMRIRRERKAKYYKERRHKKRAHARRVKAWRREKKIKARARERTRKSKIRAMRWAAARRAKELLKKRSRPRGKIGCKQAQERIAKNAVSYLGRSWCDTFRSCKKSTGRRNRNIRTWIKGQAYKEYTGTCADHHGRAVNRRFARRWSIHATFAWCKAKCDAMGPNCAGISMSSKVHRDPNAMPNYWKNARYAVGWLRKNSRKVLSWKRKGRKARRVRRVVKTSWHVKGLQCKTARVSSNRAGVIRARQWRGWTMVGGGINNKYRHFTRLSAFEESYPEGTNWRCDTGFGPGRLDCYSRQCRLGGMSCTTRRAYKNGSGTATAYLPAGYIATSGGMYNHYRSWNKKAAFETSMPYGHRAWRCDMGLGAGRFSCYVRGCRATPHKRLQCITRASRNGNWHNVQCPRGYAVTGCGQNELRRQWNHLSGFEEMRLHGNGCVCDSGFGGGNNRCYARCCRQLVAKRRVLRIRRL